MAVRQPARLIHRWCIAGGSLIALLACGLLSRANAQSWTQSPAPIPAPAPAFSPDDGYWIISARDCEGRLGPSQCSQLRVWRFDQDGHGRRATLPQFYQSLAPEVPVCLMMHGSFVDWESVCHDSRQTNRWLRSGAPGSPLHVVFFSWPSDDTPKLWLPIDVSVLGRRAERHALYVAELISMIPPDHPVSLVGHSHGGRMVASTLHVLGGGAVDNVSFAGGPYHGHRIRAVLAAAALDHHWLNPGQQYERAVHSPEAILNLVNHRDLALRFYPLHRPLRTMAALARSGLTQSDRQEIGPQHAKIVDYDITQRIRVGHIWPHYYQDAKIARVIAPYVFFTDEQPAATVRAASESLEHRGCDQ